MTFKEIIDKIRERDEDVTRCFFFWDGPTLTHIKAVRHTDPRKASGLKIPVCHTCRPGLLKVLHSVYGSQPFDYNDKVTSFYCYLMEGDKLAGIKNPDALMGWIVSTAFFFFVREKNSSNRKEGSIVPIDYVDDISSPVDNSLEKAEARRVVKEVLEAMPNRAYAKLLDEVEMEIKQFSGHERIELMKSKAAHMGISLDNLYVKLSLAKKQFRATAAKIIE